ncbi:uncharacterized protein E0L32_007630 [Thyridium curvatum]|uniref:Uncharacterized protein n=1 Tax=Thyridium curvatum TaxID=1093900 RepID=A0A507B3M1_9PEZI|nr:uncharacterized protein E0L32_007630 [Thyridium curvatum]TPX11651.1 hypothetical protein E0L32_007630 [Thyridium curvatum]
MPREQVYALRPFGWENDPEEERFKLSTLDYLTGCTYTNFFLFFRLRDDEKQHAIEVLRLGLERTLSQTRPLCGIIERDPQGGHSFVKKRDSTVKFVVQWLDGAEDADKYPSIDDLAKGHFRGTQLGDFDTWTVSPMTYGEKPEAHPDSKPVVAAFKANFVRGGLVLVMHHHHYANDIMGWAGEAFQVAENCYAVRHGTEFPPWDVKACLDLSRLTKRDPAEGDKVDGPPPQVRHPEHTGAQSLLFHCPRSKAAALKDLARPQDGSWVSTYDAFVAFVWRAITRIRAPAFAPDPGARLFWGEAVDLRRRLHSPPVHPRLQGNVMYAALSSMSAVPQPTVCELVSGWPLWQIARYVRRMTDSVSQEDLDAQLEMVALVRDKAALSVKVSAHPPLSLAVTDHRDISAVLDADFGFGRPVAYRHPIVFVTEGCMFVYPRRKGPEGEYRDDDGFEFTMAFEKRLAGDLLRDEEWNRWFEFLGVDVDYKEDE